MKVEVIKAYKSEDGCIWETEKEAVVQNVENILDNHFIFTKDGGITKQTLFTFLCNRKKELRYLLNNIVKVV